ncbi:MAG: hypothetical protein QM820_61595 [Minicystis sp.]
MKTRSSRTLRLAPLSLLGLTLAATSGGCLTRPVDPLDTRTTWTTQFKQTKSGVDKIDLLLMIDNSGSMADKQSILADAVPNLVKGLLNPPCVGDDNQPIANQPALPTDGCPVGSAREFEPIYDVHIGILSSSLGGHGSSSCDPSGGASNDDKGHLLSRIDAANPDAGNVDTYNGKGFLAWDPKQVLDPKGEATLDGTGDKLRDMVKGVGQIGCGYEAQLESWYRFLIDPEPYGSITLQGENAVVSGLDKQLLDERAAFLRPDSMVAILMLTDENDCSTREEGKYPVINNLYNTMPRGRAICATDPDNRCCAPCNDAPADCPVDDTCTAKPNLDPEEDPVNLRCWNQKARFGKDFLYPVDRYVNALKSAKIAKRNGEMVDNPLYPSDLDGHLNARTPAGGLVFLAGIVGVPWQDIARQRADGTPDLLGGLDEKGNAVGGFMSAAELAARNPATQKSRWDVILGNPEKHVPPEDPLMRESRKPRDGQNPITGDAIAPVDSTSATANPINGHEYNTDTNKDAYGHSMGDLQYACVFNLKDQDVRDCSLNSNGCDCDEADTNGSKNPLCQSTQDGSYSQMQRRAKGYPGLRQLAVLKGAGDQGIVASVCPVQVVNPSARDYGYSPAIGAIIDRLKHKLTGQCLTRPLTPLKGGGVSCVVIEARKSESGAACCDGAARRPVSTDHAAALEQAKSDPSTAGDDCFCEIAQLSGEELGVCQHDTRVVPVTSSEQPVDGWCYVDEQIGAPALLEGCAPGEKYKVRFVGAGQPAADAVTFITCAGGGN